MNDEQIKSLGQAITRQHAVAEQLAARVMQMDEVNAELLEALKDARHCIGIDRDTLVDCHTNPCTGYLDPDGALAKAEYDDVIDAADAAIARAESIETPAKVSPAQAAPASTLKPHVFRELVNDLRDLAKQFHGHDSLRDRISGRLAQDVPVVGPCGGHTVQLPDPLGLLSCTHPDCGRYEGPRSHECRAMADNACARPSICQGHAAQQEAEESCGHRFVRDEEAPRHLFCQVCGEVKNEADEARSCETCGGRGEVGGFVGGGAPGYETHPCPDCRADEAGGA